VVKTRPKLIALELLGAMFNLIWIGALLVLVYFLYGAFTKGTPWPYLGWSLAVVVIAKQIAAVLKNKEQRVDYVGQLTDRGYERDDAEAAWRIATGGGANLLRNLEQAEPSDQIDRLERSINTSSTGGDSE
jgi:hypothetical protein